MSVRLFVVFLDTFSVVVVVSSVVVFSIELEHASTELRLNTKDMSKILNFIFPFLTSQTSKGITFQKKITNTRD